MQKCNENPLKELRMTNKQVKQSNALEIAFNNALNPVPKNTIKRTSLVVTDDDIQYRETAERILKMFITMPVTVYYDNAGAGKSRSVNQFSKLLIEEAGSVEYADRITFATNTRKNRDDFITNNPGFVVIKGNGEIIADVVGNAAAEQYGSYYCNANNAGEKKKINGIQNLINDGYISESDGVNVRAEIQENKELAKASRCIAMCYAKLQVGDSLKHIYNSYVFLDEMSITRMVSATETFSIWGQDFNVSADTDLNTFTAKLFELAHHNFDSGQGIKGLCLLSAEQSIVEAVKSHIAPKFKHNGDNFMVTTPTVLIDPALTVVEVSSTNNNDKVSNRLDIANMLRSNGFKVISDGKIRSIKNADVGKSIGDFTIEGCKGQNSMKDMNLATIISYPSPYEIATVMAALGYGSEQFSDARYEATTDEEKVLDTEYNRLQKILITGMSREVKREQLVVKDKLFEMILERIENTGGVINESDAESKAISLIISDKANQAIGRNTGHRNSGNGYIHVLVVPSKLSHHLKLHTTGKTINVCTKGKLAKSIIDNPDCDVTKIFSKYFLSASYVCNEVVRDIQKKISDCLLADYMVFSIKQLKATIKRLLLKFLPPTDVRDLKLVARVIDDVSSLGYEQRRIKKEGKQWQVFVHVDLLNTEIKHIFEL